MKTPLLAEKSDKLLISSSCVYFLIVACFFAVASYELLITPGESPEQIEKYVGVWDDAMVKQCVSVKNTCVGKWISENIALWGDAIAPNAPAPNTADASMLESRRKLFTGGTQNTIDLDNGESYRGSNDGLANSVQYSQGFGSMSGSMGFGRGLGLGLKLDSDAIIPIEENVIKAEDIYPGATRVPYICPDYNVFDASMDCSKDDARWKKESEKKLGAGQFGDVYVSEYNKEAPKNAILSPFLDANQPKIVQKRAKGNVPIGHIMVEALLMFAAQDRMQDVTVKAVDVYENYLITQPLASGELSAIADLIKGNPGAATYIASQMYDKLERLHGHGLVHRDIKPGNVLFMVKPFRIILGDVGSALPLPAQNADKMKWIAGGMTLQYWSPELGNSLVNGAADPENIVVDYRSNDLWAASYGIFYLYFGKFFMSVKFDAMDNGPVMSGAMHDYWTKGKVDDQLKAVLTAAELKDPLIDFFKVVLAPKAGGRSDGAALKALATEYFTKLKGDFNLNTFAVVEKPKSPAKAKPSAKTDDSALPKTEKKKVIKAETAPAAPVDHLKKKGRRAEHSNQ